MKLPRLILSVDTETGGLDPKQHSLLTIGMVPIVDGEILSGREWPLYQPFYRFVPEAMAKNKIDLQEHIKIAQHPEDVLASMRMFVANLHLEHGDGERLHILGQNLDFDLGFLREQFKNLSFFGRGKIPKFDTDMIAALLKIHGRYPQDRSTSNESMAEYYQLDKPPHSACADAHITAQIFLAQMREMSV